ncbi:MAG: hypothetical protein WAM66_01445 [Acidobacteriaceae bacterium]
MIQSRAAFLAVALFVSLSLSACRSAFVQAVIVNRTGATVKLVEVDYPFASFGRQQIAENATYNYHFKILGSGPVKVTFTGSGNKIHTATGPTLDLGQQGNLTIILEGDGKVEWVSKLSPAK